MNRDIMMMIIGMGIVTYIPRMLPLVALNGKNMPSFLQGILKNVPYATLGALIVPSIFLIDKSDLWFGVVGAVAAVVIAYLGANVIVVVLGAIAVLSVYTYFF
jgi:branched-subunit amino acid transport protein